MPSHPGLRRAARVGAALDKAYNIWSPVGQGLGGGSGSVS